MIDDDADGRIVGLGPKWSSCGQNNHQNRHQHENSGCRELRTTRRRRLAVVNGGRASERNVTGADPRARDVVCISAGRVRGAFTSEPFASELIAYPISAIRWCTADQLHTGRTTLCEPTHCVGSEHARTIDPHHGLVGLRW